MPSDEAILIRVELDKLDVFEAHYKSQENSHSATISRGIFDEQGHPTAIVIWVPKGVEQPVE